MNRNFFTTMLLNQLKTSGNLMFANGILPIDLQTPAAFLPEYVEEQARRIIHNIGELSVPTPFSLSDVVSVNISLCQFKKFYPRINILYSELFDQFNHPTISCVGVEALPRDALIAMSFVFAK